MAGSPIEILLVEDNPGDVRLTREALDEAKVINNLSVVDNGVDALAFLRQEAPYADAVRPDLILLDLNLPKKDGRQVLAEIKEDTRLKRIPVVILTTSQAEEDIIKALSPNGSRIAPSRVIWFSLRAKNPSTPSSKIIPAKRPIATYL